MNSQYVRVYVCVLELKSNLSAKSQSVATQPALIHMHRVIYRERERARQIGRFWKVLFVPKMDIARLFGWARVDRPWRLWTQY